MTTKTEETKTTDTAPAATETVTPPATTETAHAEAPPAADPAKAEADKAAADAAAKEAEKAARKETRRTKIDGLSELAQRTKEAFLETAAARQAREAAEQTKANTTAELEAARAELKAFRDDPVAYLESQGITAEKIAERIIKKGETDAPLDEKVQSALKEALDRAKAAEAKADKLIKDAEAREARAKAVENWEKAKADMVSEFETGRESKYEHLDAFATRLAERSGRPKATVVFDEFMTHVDRLKRDPRYAQAIERGMYSDAEILEAVNDYYEGAYAKPKPAAAPAPAAKEPVVEKPSLTVAKPAESAPAEKPAPPTLTNSQGSERSSALPDNWDKLSDKEQNKLIVKMIREGTLPGLVRNT